eukprot:m.336035 g.336035  ORF g.336035 m.336035 type:complete len:75 (+) comp104138_c0_seq1:242-466(+)
MSMDKNNEFEKETDGCIVRGEEQCVQYWRGLMSMVKNNECAVREGEYSDEGRSTSVVFELFEKENKNCAVRRAE